MKKQHTLLKGTFILTATGLVSRVMGFFFRIFLSHTFGEEQVGLYQLIFPVYALCLSFTCIGLQNAVSRCVAQKLAIGKPEDGERILYISMGISGFVSLLVFFLLQLFSTRLAIDLLGDIRCEPLLYYISYAIPFASLHSCIIGYYYGKKQTFIPAVSQIMEQGIRILTVLLLCRLTPDSDAPSISLAVGGLVLGEFFTLFFCIQYHYSKKQNHKGNRRPASLLSLTRELSAFAIPFTGNKLLLHLLQGIESISIPLKLQVFGLSPSEALTHYGVLTGMALPCVLFPTAITNSVATMLLPTVTELHEVNQKTSLQALTKKVISVCLIMGFSCCVAFFFLAPFIGQILFHSELAASYLRVLCFICPFLYLNTTLLSMINGLGNARYVFVLNACSLLIRILGVWYCIPRFGMNGYLWPLLFSQILVSLLGFYKLKTTTTNL